MKRKVFQRFSEGKLVSLPVLSVPTDRKGQVRKLPLFILFHRFFFFKKKKGQKKAEKGRDRLENLPSNSIFEGYSCP
jgi:hypothetical protein